MKFLGKVLWCLFTWLAFPVVWLVIVPLMLVFDYLMKLPFDKDTIKELFRMMIHDMTMGLLG